MHYLEIYLCISVLAGICLYVFKGERFVRPNKLIAYVVLALLWPLMLLLWLFYAGAPEEWD